MTDFWQNKRVFVTGHTGFKGGWLCHMLYILGAKLGGFSLAPPTNPNLYTLTNLQEIMDSTLGDIRDFIALKNALDKFQPDILFHLAAQPLVRESYNDPIGTYNTNVLGTVHLFEAIRKLDRSVTIINVTTDKCYDNKEWCYPYRENDSLGGYDPYSNSKACSELVTECYNNSFFKATLRTEKRIALASARAGNVIGGGDWAADRLIPDCVRAVMNKETIIVRSPNAVRPWQHVLDPLHGYILLAQKVFEDPLHTLGPWNFGPSHLDFKTVSWVVGQTVGALGGHWELAPSLQQGYHEAKYLTLDSSKASQFLGWMPKLSIQEAIDWTSQWYKVFLAAPEKVTDITYQQIKGFLSHENI